MSSALARLGVACLGMALYAGVPGNAAPSAVEAAVSPWTPSPLSVAAEEEGGGGDEEPEPESDDSGGSDDAE